MDYNSVYLSLDKLQVLKSYFNLNEFNEIKSMNPYDKG